MSNSWNSAVLITTANDGTNSKLTITAISATSVDLANVGYQCKATYSYDSIGAIPSDIAYAYVRRELCFPRKPFFIFEINIAGLTSIYSIYGTRVEKIFYIFERVM